MLKWIGRIFLGLLVLIAAAGIALYQSDVPRAEAVARYGGPPSKFVTLMSGAVAHYRSYGPEDAPVLLLLHGSNASLHTWEPWAKLLAGDYRVVTVDLPGHGLTGSVPGDDYSQKGMAAFVLEFAAALDLKSFAIGGNSMGGGVAARFVIENPGIATSLILVDAAGQKSARQTDPGIGFKLARMPVIQEIIPFLGSRLIYEATLKKAIADDALVTDAMIDRYALLNRMAGTRQATLKRFQTAPDSTLETRAGEIAIPTLILWGDQDSLIPVDAAEVWKSKVKGAELIVYPGVGHIPMEETPETSAKDVAAFLAKHAPES
jgi:pimeloyl-ACP methyl ester carboxylesterase